MVLFILKVPITASVASNRISKKRDVTASVSSYSSKSRFQVRSYFQALTEKICSI